jgi:glycine dehydrogenase subunit 2
MATVHDLMVESETELKDGEKPFGRMTGFHGQMGMLCARLPT